MTSKRDPIEVVVRVGGRPFVEGDERSSIQLGISDRPTEVRVRVFGSESRITLDFLYPAGMLEARMPVVANHVQCFLGEYSRRLLGLSLSFERNPDVAALARRIMRDLF